MRFVFTMSNEVFITRILASEFPRLQKQFPILSVTGPRQSGKTSLCKNVFHDYRYANLELAMTRTAAENDPAAFLRAFGNNGAIIDEAQRVPELFSAAQVLVDEDRSRKFVFTGSSNFLLMKNISQSLAGRVAITKLLPFSLAELSEFAANADVDELIFRGGFPAIWKPDARPDDIFANYYETYIERDVRQVEEIRNLRSFRDFIRLCASSTGSEFNASAFAKSLGVSIQTVQSWTSVLESSYVVIRLPAFFRNIRKTIVKRPKLYMCDTGLACWLLGIESAEQLKSHPLRGALFENLIVLEFFKRRFSSAARTDTLFFYRDQAQKEIDLVEERAGKLLAYEIKSTTSFRKDFFKNLNYFRSVFGSEVRSTQLIYAGETELPSENNGIINFRNL